MDFKWGKDSPGRRSRSIEAARSASQTAISQSAHRVLQLTIALEHVPTGITDPDAVGRQGGPAAQQVCPAHALQAVAEPSGGGAARCQGARIKGAGAGGRQADKENPKESYFHLLVFPLTI